MRFFISFLFLFAFWLIWSGLYDPFHLTLGVVSTLIVSWWSSDMLVKHPDIKFGQRLKMIFRFERYTIWLFWEIVLANLHVMSVILSPNMRDKLNPKIMTFKSKLSSETTQFILAHSITLTPGTVTVRVKENEFMVHALTRQTADGCPGEMEKRISEIFEEGAS